MTTYNGFRIVEDRNMVVPGEDWSRVRSPARARRRRAKHRQNIKFVMVPSRAVYRVADTLIMHPDMAKELLAKVEA